MLLPQVRPSALPTSPRRSDSRSGNGRSPITRAHAEPKTTSEPLAAHGVLAAIDATLSGNGRAVVTHVLDSGSKEGSLEVLPRIVPQA